MALGLAAVWVMATLVFAYHRPALPGWIGPIWLPALLAWGIAGGGIALRWYRHRHRNRCPQDRLGPGLAALAGAIVLAVALSAAQLFPVVEFTAMSSRVGEVKTLTLSKFSMEPYRLVECFWPAVFGRPFPENRTWIQAIPPVNDRQLWQHSLYVGGLVPLLFLGTAGFRANPAWRRG